MSDQDKVKVLTVSLDPEGVYVEFGNQMLTSDDREKHLGEWGRYPTDQWPAILAQVVEKVSVAMYGGNSGSEQLTEEVIDRRAWYLRDISRDRFRKYEEYISRKNEEVKPIDPITEEEFDRDLAEMLGEPEPLGREEFTEKPGDQ